MAVRDKALDKLLREEARAARESRRKPPRPRSYWLRHQREKCWCLGYWFPHRRGGGACDHSPRVDYYRALRDGASVEEAMQLLTASDLRKLYPIPGDD